jgi:endonuclease-3 related protein
MKRPPSLLWIYRRLHQTHGPQHWWPGDSPFEIMVGAVLTQNTAWTNVEKAIANLKRARALRAQTIRATPHRTLAAWLQPSGYFNVKARRLRALCDWLVEQGGVARLARLPTPALRTALLGVHGVGPETADDILLYAFERPVFVIDAYTRRLFSRLGAIAGDERYDVLRVRFERALGADVARMNEYHALIVTHGKDVCRARPRCVACCFVRTCPTAAGARPTDRPRPAVR